MIVFFVFFPQDIKSANVLLTRDGTAKLADVGMSRVLSRSHLSPGGTGTFAWSAPEVLAGRRCSEKADIYSWGVVLWEVCTGEPPVRGNMRPLQCPDDCPAEVIELHRRCLAEDPDERPSAREIVHLLLRLLPVRLGGTLTPRN
jgi:serine/threonine protein kinase